MLFKKNFSFNIAFNTSHLGNRFYALNSALFGKLSYQDLISSITQGSGREISIVFNWGLLLIICFVFFIIYRVFVFSRLTIKNVITTFAAAVVKAAKDVENTVNQSTVNQVIAEQSKSIDWMWYCKAGVITITSCVVVYCVGQVCYEYVVGFREMIDSVGNIASIGALVPDPEFAAVKPVANAAIQVARPFAEIALAAAASSRLPSDDIRSLRVDRAFLKCTEKICQVFDKVGGNPPKKVMVEILNKTLMNDPEFVKHFDYILENKPYFREQSIAYIDACNNIVKNVDHPNPYEYILAMTKLNNGANVIDKAVIPEFKFKVVQSNISSSSPSSSSGTISSVQESTFFDSMFDYSNIFQSNLILFLTIFFIILLLYKVFVVSRLTIKKRFLNTATAVSVTVDKPVDQEEKIVEEVCADCYDPFNAYFDVDEEALLYIYNRSRADGRDFFECLGEYCYGREKFYEYIFKTSSDNNVKYDFIEHFYLNLYALNTPQQLLFFSFLLFLIGLIAFVFNKSNMILLLISLEIMLLGISLSFIFISLITLTPQGQIYALIILAIAAAESAIGLALIITFYRLKTAVNSSSLRYLRG